MPSSQFMRLAEEKRQKIATALLHEFTSHSLADAQVARIVKEAGIARGAFYNYFADLTDAYSYLFGLEMRRIHQPLKLANNEVLSADEYVQQVANFLEEIEKCELRQLFLFHFQTNAGLLLQSTHGKRRTMKDDISSMLWAVETLAHQAINDAILNPESKDLILKRLSTALHQLEKE